MRPISTPTTYSASEPDAGEQEPERADERDPHRHPHRRHAEVAGERSDERRHQQPDAAGGRDDALRDRRRVEVLDRDRQQHRRLEREQHPERDRTEHVDDLGAPHDLALDALPVHDDPVCRAVGRSRGGMFVSGEAGSGALDGDVVYREACEVSDVGAVHS